MRGLLVIGHGSRREQANETVRELARQLAAVDSERQGDGERQGDSERQGDGERQGDSERQDDGERQGDSERQGDGERQRDGERQWAAVEPAFLELVEPDIAAGYRTLAEAGCVEIVVHPFFLFAGNHTNRDIPAALASAQRNHPGTRWTLTEPLGLHPGVLDAARARIGAAIEAAGEAIEAASR